ncbi:uncharacterized protein LOC110029765 [Phalaenopsis equestris]|uniref:uncharacterized protein LOC110029765 n=1 Tax=Phalaenopsis equestris TaxID=78828 RepID=UPI0009E6570C|nr:uncharacterized protein LOC110029765 [Phalaenopsis equestris]
MSLPLPAFAAKPLSEISVKQFDLKFQQRRSIFYGLVGAGIGLSLFCNDVSAAKRQPPAPLMEKKDPNVSGVQAKVLASKKRKEEFKEEVARLREKGRETSR